MFRLLRVGVKACNDAVMGRDGSSSRRNVLEAAGRIVADRGLEGIRIREIAAEAELSPGAVLYHFPDHSELLYAVHVDTVRRYVEGRVGAAATEAVGGPADPIERLLAVLRAGVPPWANEHVIRLLYEMHGLARRSPRHAELLTRLWQDEQALYADIIADGLRQGVFAVDGSVADVAAGLLALEDGLVLHRISNNHEMPSDRVVAIFAGVAAEQLNCPGILSATRS